MNKGNLNKLVTNYPVDLTEEEIRNLSGTLAPVIPSAVSSFPDSVQYAKKTYVDSTFQNKNDMSAYATTYYVDGKIDSIYYTDIGDLVEALNAKQDKLTFGYDENDAISSINNHTLAGAGGSGQGSSCFPMTGTDGTTSYFANATFSSYTWTTGEGRAGAHVRQTVHGVLYQAYPTTDISASWYNIINATNNRSNCYCIRFTNDMTAASLEDYSAYDKVTVVHSNEYTPDCMLYWVGKTKVFPSGLYCELVKGTNDQNQTDWFFTTSGWINNVDWV